MNNAVYMYNPSAAAVYGIHMHQICSALPSVIGKYASQHGIAAVAARHFQGAWRSKATHLK